MNHESFRPPRDAGQPREGPEQTRHRHELPLIGPSTSRSGPSIDDEGPSTARGASDFSRQTETPSTNPTASVSGPLKRLRRVASSPDSFRPDPVWRKAAAADPSGDDSAPFVLPGRHDDLSAAHTDDLDPTILDAKDLHRWNIRSGLQPGGKRKKGIAALVACRRCGIDDTPKWRDGPDGSKTLCNVCGLLFARRKRRLLQDEVGGRDQQGETLL